MTLLEANFVVVDVVLVLNVVVVLVVVADHIIYEVLVNKFLSDVPEGYS